MNKRFTYIDDNILNKFHTCKFNEWYPQINANSNSIYKEYDFFKQKLEMNRQVELVKEEEIIYIKVAEYKYNDLKFKMVVDLDYDITDFIVEDKTRIENIRELIESSILKNME